MKIILVLLMVGFGLEVNAQKISGIVTDEKSEPIAYASIVLLQASDSSFVTGTTTDEEGLFQIEADSGGKSLKVSYVGYATQFLQPSQNMAIVLKEEGMTIGDVVITGNRPTYKMKGGALVAPVANTVLGKLGDANDVLTQLPMVSKNSEGYQVIGRGKPLIYINNRLMRDSKELDEIKSSEIKDIRVELNPGSRYSAEVGAVIKITTLRPVGEGLGGYVQATLMRHARTSYNEQANLNYRHKGLDAFFNEYVGKSALKQTQSDITSFEFRDTPISADQHGTIQSDSRYLALSGGFNYNPDKRQLFGVRYDLTKMLGFDADVNFDGTYSKGEDQTTYHTYQTQDFPKNIKHQVNGFYQNEISDNWQVNADLTYMNDRELRTGYQTEDRIGAPAEVNSKNSTKSSLWALKAWSSNKWLGGMLEWGIEGTLTRSEQAYQMLNDEVAQYIPSTENLSRQKAQSLFLTYSHPIGQVNLSMGLRYEYVDFDYEVNHQRNDEVCRTYSNLFPTLSLAYVKNRTSLNLAYRTIVGRPNYSSLSSFVQYNSSFSTEGGNPELLPTFTHRLSLTLQHRNWVFDATYNYAQDAIITNTYVLNNQPMVMSTNQNHEMQNYQASLTYSPAIGVWRPSFMVSVSGQELHVNGQSFSGVGLDYQWKNLFVLPKAWIISLNLTGNSAKISSVRHAYADFCANMTVRKTIGQWQLTAGLTDIFNTSRESFWCDMNGTHFDKHNNYNQQGFYFRAVYSFNPVKSKYKGGQAGQSELNRL